MKEEVTPSMSDYEEPTIEVLGDFAHLTLGNKFHSFSDLSQGIGNAIADGGIGS
jgi:hypothetical protein